MAPPPKYSQASSKDLQASTQKVLPQPAPQKAPQALSLFLTESLSKLLTYKERLAIFTAWPHTLSIAEKIADTRFSHQSTSKKPNNIICKKCNT